MPNVREVFPGLEKLRRVKRGRQPQTMWTHAPSLETVIPKLATNIVDSHVKTSETNGVVTEMRRYVLRSGNRFGYLCIKTANIALATCKSYSDFQRVVDSLEQSIKWSNSLPRLIEYVTAHCTSPSYINRVSQLQV